MVAIIINIFNEREIQKDDRTLHLETLKIGDPLTEQTMDVNIWNKQIVLKAEMIGQSYLLKHFKLTKFKDQSSLQSTFRSEMIRHSFFE